MSYIKRSCPGPNVVNMIKRKASMNERRLISKSFMTAIGLAVGLSLCLAKGVATAQQGAAAPPKAASVDAIPPVVTVATNEWLKWGYDMVRTLWNRAVKVQ